MQVGKEFVDCLTELGDSNILSSNRAISDFLRASADNTELIEYLEHHGKNVSLTDELRDFQKTGKFPSDPRRALPFIYTLLYLLASGKMSLDVFLSGFYKAKDTVDAYESFANGLMNAIAAGILNADSNLCEEDSEVHETVTENADSEIKEIFERLYADIGSTVRSEALEETCAISSRLYDAVNEGDADRIKSTYLELFVALSRYGDVAVLDGVKSALLARQIEV